MPYLSLAVAGLLALAATINSESHAARETKLYVSPQGSDSWSGQSSRPNRSKTDGPLATPHRAREVVRSLKAQGKADGPVTVYLRGGTYFLREPLRFTPEDSGAEGAPVTYTAYRNEEPVLSGGRRITGWKRGEGSLWRASVPGAKGDGYFRQLFVNGERRQRARTPNDGFYRVEGDVSTEEQARFKFHGDEIKPEWADRGDVEVLSLNKWAEIRMPIRHVDVPSRTATLAGKVHEWIREKDQRYYIENLFEALDSPGEWYLDRKTETLYYWPMPGEDPTQAEIIAPALTELVRLQGDPANGRYVRNLRLKGLTFSHADWTLGENGYADIQAAYDIPAAVMAEGAVSCRIEKCLFTRLGRYALELGRGCKHNEIVGNEMTDLGAGGIKIGEPTIRDDEAEQTGHNIITDNHIHHIGLVYPAAVGVWVAQSGDNRIAYNHVHHTYYTAFSLGWTWGYGKTNARNNIVEYNHAHDIGQGMLSDMGGIYTLGVQPGTTIRHNLFHDISSWGYGGWGIYPDEGSSELLIENNVVYRTKTGGFHQHYGRENLVRNNIFALATEGQLIRTRLEPHISFIIEGNIVYWDKGPLLGGNWRGNDNFKIDRNLYWNQGEPFDFAGLSLEEWRERGHDVHSVIADPLFVNPEKGDFRLKPNSPAFKLGFKPIDVSKVGPRKSYLRQLR